MKDDMDMTLTWGIVAFSIVAVLLGFLILVKCNEGKMSKSSQEDQEYNKHYQELLKEQEAKTGKAAP